MLRNVIDIAEFTNGEIRAIWGWALTGNNETEALGAGDKSESMKAGLGSVLK